MLPKIIQLMCLQLNKLLQYTGSCQAGGAGGGRGPGAGGSGSSCALACALACVCCRSSQSHSQWE